MDFSVLQKMEKYDHEEVVFFQDKSVGLKAIVAIHNTTLGPALGGTRMWNYASEEEALRDVLRLSRAMTYKAAVSGLNLGGGKAVILGDPKRDKSQTLFKVYGQFINTLGGRYITAEDVNTDINDMEYVFSETDYVVGIDKSHGGSGDPSPFTALGVLEGIKASLGKVFGDETVKGRKIVIQGVGAVGSQLVALLVNEGASVWVSDIDAEKVRQIREEWKVEAVPPREDLSMECDIFAPCALGAIINDETVDKLGCKIVAGSANNQLDRREHGEMLRKRGILYAPDYVINAGGLINVSLELEGYSRERAKHLTRGIYYTLKNVFRLSDEMNLSTVQAAETLAEQRLEKSRKSAAMFSKSRKSVLDKVTHRLSLRK